MSTPAVDSAWLDLVRRKVGSVRFGVVQIVVHDHRVTQIEVTEKVRLETGPVPPPVARSTG